MFSHPNTEFSDAPRFRMCNMIKWKMCGRLHFEDEQVIRPHLLHLLLADGHEGRALQWIFEDVH